MYIMNTNPVRGKPLNHIGLTSVEKLHDEWLLMRFAVMANVQTSPDTAAQYVSHVRAWHKLYVGYDLGPVADTHRLTLLMKGLKKLSKSGLKSNRKLPITLDQLLAWEAYFKSEPSTYNTVFRAASYTAFQGLLRVSEYAVKGTAASFDPAVHLTRADIHFHPSIKDPEYAAVNLGRTKTDPDNEDRVPVILAFDPDADVNACSALRDMILADPVPASIARFVPLFRWQDGTAMTYAQVGKAIDKLMPRIGVSPARYASHSFRIGGATALADAGCPDVIIQALGRWRSQCYKIYCRAAKHSVLRWGKVIGTHHVHPLA
jgi:hypothetical protein